MNTKKIFSLILAIGMMMTSFATAVFAAEDAKLIINGESQDYSLFLTGDVGSYHILAPAQEFSAALGASFSWNEEEEQITVEKDSTTIAFTMEKVTAAVNNKTEKLEVPAKLVDGEPFVPVEFIGKEFGYHVFSEIAGKRVRIVSKTSTTAPALTQKEGMAELVSEVHRPVPTEFTKSNRLDDLIFAKENYEGVVKTTKDTMYSEMPDGEIIFSQDDFMAEMDKSNDGVANWFDNCMQTQMVDSEYDIPDEGRISMDVWMKNLFIGKGANYKYMPFEKALRLDITETMQTSQDKQIHFAKKLPSPSETDKYTLTFYARLIEGGDPDYGTGKVEIRVQKPVTYDQSLLAQVEFGKKWQRFDFLLTGKEGANTIVFLPMHHKQIIEIGGFEIRDIGENADVSYFNNKKVDLLAEELSPDAQWRKEALDRIEEVRKGDFTVVVKDKNGNPVENANVTFDMFEHEFKFGIALDLEYVSDDKLEGYVVQNNGTHEKDFIERVGSDFNATSQGNRLKWNVYATDEMNNPGKTSTARIVMDEGTSQGLKYHRGHALWMPVESLTTEPQAMYDLLENDSRPLDERYADLLGFIEEHFARMDEEFPEIYEWDVTNETHVRTFFINKFGERLLEDVYRIANEKLTHGQKLVLTDNAQFKDYYWERLDDFRDWGVKYDAFGMQGHSVIGSNDTANNYRPQKWLEVWDRFAYEYQKTFAVTEFSVGAFKNEYGYSGQADYMRDIMIAAFSHPACTGFGIWWLADYWSDWHTPYNAENPNNKGNGAGIAPLYTHTFEAKPGLAIYRDLLYNKWWTKGANATTDKNGKGTVSGFYGDYDITVTVNGQVVKTEMAAFHKGYENVLTITLQ